MKLARTFQVRPELFALIPLISVIFLALLLFTLSSRFTLQPGLLVRPPSSSFTLTPPVNPLLITITAAPIPSIYFGEEKVTPERLNTLLQSERLSGRTVIIRADSDTPYDRIVEISNIALQHKLSVALALASAPDSSPRFHNESSVTSPKTP